MGDFSCEAIYRCDPRDCTILFNAKTADDGINALNQIHETASQRVEFRGCEYDHIQYLPVLNDLFARREYLAFDRYAERPIIHYRIINAVDISTQAHAILELIARLKENPTPLIEVIHKEAEQMVAAYRKAMKRPDSSASTMRHYSEGLRTATSALEQFSLSATDVRTLFHIAKIGGFYPGDAPEELVAMANIHTPNSSALTSLCQSFGFLKSIIPIYEDAADAGQSIVHLQVYGT